MNIEDRVFDKSQTKNAPAKEKKFPRVSIGMPVYNGELFIREALVSLLEQTFTNFELIISDNASTDSTKVICREYAAKDSRIRYVRQVENLGALANFQFVLDEAVGEYFMWAAADDLQTPDFIELLVTALDDNPSFVCVMSDVINVKDSIKNNSFESVLDDIRINDVKENWAKCRRRFFRNPTSNIFFCIYGIFRTKIIKSIELNYNNLTKYYSSSEVAILAQIAARGQVASIPKLAKIYRRNDLSVYHQEQKILKFKDHLVGFISVSLSLFLIALRSNFSIYQKLTLIGTTAIAGFRGTAIFFLIKIYQSLRNTLTFKKK
jgi:glycosyltransferase involved in cell wall biosynthesis